MRCLRLAFDTNVLLDIAEVKARRFIGKPSRASPKAASWHVRRCRPQQRAGTELIDELVKRRSLSQIATMEAAVKNEFVSVADYLASEEASQIRHEYLGGLVYAMAGETRDNNQIIQNLAFALRQKLKGGPCKFYISDVRVNFHLHTDEYYYYPDIVVTCDKRDTHPRFIRHPKLIIEVLSASTERVDKREKFFAYTSVESLQEYVLVSQTVKEVTVFRRGTTWKAEKKSGSKARVKLASLNLSLPLGAIYEGV
jgi:Uma2 family endonuclease